MKQVKQNLTEKEALNWVAENADDLKLLKRNRNLSLNVVAQNLSKEVQAGMIARGETDKWTVDKCFSFVDELHNRIHAELVRTIEA